MASLCSAESSGSPYAHPSAVLCAVDASITLTFSFSIRLTASIAAASGKQRNTMSEEFGNNIVSVLDDEGNEHQFEVLDAIETDEGRYVALLPVYSEAEAAIEDDGELVILEVVNDQGDDLLVPIEDDEMFDNIAGIFEERLAEYYEINQVEEPIS